MKEGQSVKANRSSLMLAEFLDTVSQWQTCGHSLTVAQLLDTVSQWQTCGHSLTVAKLLDTVSQWQTCGHGLTVAQLLDQCLGHCFTVASVWKQSHSGNDTVSQ